MQTDNGTAADRWLPLAEAAALLGLSVDTIRRRVKRGELVGEQRPTPQGFVWWVRLGNRGDAAHLDADLGSDPPRQAAYAELPTRNGERDALVDLVREQQAELLRRTEAATAWQVRAEVLRMQLEQAHAELRALKAPETAQNATQASNLTAEAPEPTTAPSDPPAEPPWPTAPDPLPPTTDGRQPRPNGSGLWGRVRAWLLA